MTATLQTPASRTAPGMRWGRVLAGAILLEIVLIAVLIPIGIAFTPPGGEMTDSLVFLIAVPIGAFLGGVAVSAWMLRTVTERRPLHGALIGIVATLIYFAMCAAQPGGIPAVAAAYGPLLFWFSQALRIGGSVAGATSTRGR